MWPPVTPMMLAGWVCVLLAAESAHSEVTFYKKVGDDVVLEPGPVSAPITSIMWKHESNIAVQWDGTDIDSYRQFRERGSLNISSGEMTITGLTQGDGGLYTPEINNVAAPATRLSVISPVPVPAVTKTCDDEETHCTLTCEGDTTGAAPVTYRWKSGDIVLTDLSMKKLITKEDNSSAYEFSCELENPVSRESSKPIPNPFITTSRGVVPGNMKISTGVTVFICLLAAVLLLVFIHRLKAGMWFFQKASMPWEADFWRKNESTTREAAESNGTAARQEKEQTDEETPMA